MEGESKRINDILKALNNELRRKILILLFTHGKFRYSDLMHELGMSPESDSGWFAYHIKTLLDAGLIKRDNGNYYLSRIGRRAVLLIEEIGKPEESISIRVIEGLLRMEIIDEIKATWALLNFLFGVILCIYYLTTNFQNILFIVAGSLFLVISIILYTSLAVSLKSVYCLPIFLNIYWILMRPQRWKEISAILLSGCLSIFFLFKPFKLNSLNLNIIFSVFFIILAFLLTIFLFKRKEKYI